MAPFVPETEEATESFKNRLFNNAPQEEPRKGARHGELRICIDQIVSPLSIEVQLDQMVYHVKDNITTFLVVMLQNMDAEEQLIDAITALLAISKVNPQLYRNYVYCVEYILQRIDREDIVVDRELYFLLLDFVYRKLPVLCGEDKAHEKLDIEGVTIKLAEFILSTNELEPKEIDLTIIAFLNLVKEALGAAQTAEKIIYTLLMELYCFVEKIIDEVSLYQLFLISRSTHGFEFHTLANELLHMLAENEIIDESLKHLIVFQLTVIELVFSPEVKVRNELRLPQIGHLDAIEQIISGFINGDDRHITVSALKAETWSMNDVAGEEESQGGTTYQYNFSIYKELKEASLIAVKQEELREENKICVLSMFRRIFIHESEHPELQHITEGRDHSYVDIVDDLDVSRGQFEHFVKQTTDFYLDHGEYIKASCRQMQYVIDYLLNLCNIFAKDQLAILWQFVQVLFKNVHDGKDIAVDLNMHTAEYTQTDYNKRQQQLNALEDYALETIYHQLSQVQEQDTMQQFNVSSQLDYQTLFEIVDTLNLPPGNALVLPIIEFIIYQVVQSNIESTVLNRVLENSAFQRIFNTNKVRYTLIEGGEVHMDTEVTHDDSNFMFFLLQTDAVCMDVLRHIKFDVPIYSEHCDDVLERRCLDANKYLAVQFADRATERFRALNEIITLYHTLKDGILSDLSQGLEQLSLDNSASASFSDDSASSLEGGIKLIRYIMISCQLCDIPMGRLGTGDAPCVLGEQRVLHVARYLYERVERLNNAYKELCGTAIGHRSSETLRAHVAAHVTNFLDFIELAAALEGEFVSNTLQTLAYCNILHINSEFGHLLHGCEDGNILCVAEQINKFYLFKPPVEQPEDFRSELLSSISFKTVNQNKPSNQIINMFLNYHCNAEFISELNGIARQVVVEEFRFFSELFSMENSADSYASPQNQSKKGVKQTPKTFLNSVNRAKLQPASQDSSNQEKLIKAGLFLVDDGQGVDSLIGMMNYVEYTDIISILLFRMALSVPNETYYINIYKVILGYCIAMYKHYQDHFVHNEAKISGLFRVQFYKIIVDLIEHHVAREKVDNADLQKLLCSVRHNRIKYYNKDFIAYILDSMVILLKVGGDTADHLIEYISQLVRAINSRQISLPCDSDLLAGMKQYYENAPGLSPEYFSEHATQSQNKHEYLKISFETPNSQIVQNGFKNFEEDLRKYIVNELDLAYMFNVYFKNAGKPVFVNSVDHLPDFNTKCLASQVAKFERLVIVYFSTLQYQLEETIDNIQLNLENTSPYIFELNEYLLEFKHIFELLPTKNQMFVMMKLRMLYYYCIIAKHIKLFNIKKDKAYHFTNSTIKYQSIQELKAFLDQNIESNMLYSVELTEVWNKIAEANIEQISSRIHGPTMQSPSVCSQYLENLIEIGAKGSSALMDTGYELTLDSWPSTASILESNHEVVLLTNYLRQISGGFSMSMDAALIEHSHQIVANIQLSLFSGNLLSVIREYPGLFTIQLATDCYCLFDGHHHFELERHSGRANRDIGTLPCNLALKNSYCLLKYVITRLKDFHVRAPKPHDQPHGGRISEEDGVVVVSYLQMELYYDSKLLPTLNECVDDRYYEFFQHSEIELIAQLDQLIYEVAPFIKEDSYLEIADGSVYERVFR